MARALSVAVMSVLLMASAHAQSTARSSRLPLPARPLEREITLPRGWFEWGAQLKIHRVRGSFDAAGRRQPLEDVAQTLSPAVSLRAGVTRRVELFWEAGMSVHRRDAQTWAGLTDPEFGVRWTFVADPEQQASGAIDLVYRAAGGREGPAHLSSSAESARGASFSLGVPEARAVLRLRRRVEMVRLDAAVGVVFRAPGHSAYSAGDPALRIDPGEAVWVEGSTLVQAGPLAGVLGGSGTRWMMDRVGGERVASDGWDVAVSAGAVLSVSRGLDLSVSGRWMPRGRPTHFLFNEVLSPTWGPDIAVGAQWRH